ncbi:MAG: hypothetical protein ABEJ24_04305 [Candidatus Magasanikbacteria bacterium]
MDAEEQEEVDLEELIAKVKEIQRDISGGYETEDHGDGVTVIKPEEFSKED